MLARWVTTARGRRCRSVSAVRAGTSGWCGRERGGGRRPLASGATTGHARAAGGEPGRVENEDYASGLLRLASGARVVVEASRVAVGEQNNYGFEAGTWAKVTTA
jgi:predicted dehydrogenase